MRLHCFGLLFCLIASSSSAENDKLRNIIQQGMVSAEIINALTFADVPDDWRAIKTVKETESHVLNTFSRKGMKVMEVLWSKNWTGDKSRMFGCTVFADDHPVARIMRIRDSVMVMPDTKAEGISVVTSVKDGGALSIGVFRADTSMVDTIIIDDRDSHLIDDLEYTKNVLTADLAIRPLMNVIQGGLEEARESKVRQSEKTAPEKQP